MISVLSCEQMTTNQVLTVQKEDYDVGETNWKMIWASCVQSHLSQRHSDCVRNLLKDRRSAKHLLIRSTANWHQNSCGLAMEEPDTWVAKGDTRPARRSCFAPVRMGLRGVRLSSDRGWWREERSKLCTFTNTSPPVLSLLVGLAVGCWLYVRESGVKSVKRPGSAPQSPEKATSTYYVSQPRAGLVSLEYNLSFHF